MAIEQTLIILKPDAVQRKLAGRILQEFEDRGLSFTRLEMRVATPELIEQHYPSSEEWLVNVGKKTLDSCLKYGIDPEVKYHTRDPLTIGKMIKGWLEKYMTAGPIIVGVVEGHHAAEVVRKICGPTRGIEADPGTIRGKYSMDSSDIANEELRPVMNLIHTSENAEEAQREIALWFGK